MKVLSLTFVLALWLPQAALAHEVGVELWGGLKAGMSAEEVAAALRAKVGIKAAVAKRDKKGRETVDVKYVGQGLDIAGKPARVLTLFSSGRLSAVRIMPAPGSFGLAFCLSRGQTAFNYYRTLLLQKYERNYEASTQFDDLFVSRLRLDRIGKRYYSPSVRTISEGFTDGKVQVFNIVELKAATDTSDQKLSFNFEYSLCRDDVGLYATPMLLYMSKAAADAAISRNAQQREQALKSLSDEL